MYRWVEHTAELELRIEAPSEEGVFADGLAAYGELIGQEPGGEPASHEVAARAPDRATLLAEWIGELVFLAETESFIPERLTSFELGPDGLRATVEGRRGRPPHLVKAVTYHDLELRRDGDAWRARVVLDV